MYFFQWQDRCRNSNKLCWLYLVWYYEDYYRTYQHQERTCSGISTTQPHLHYTKPRQIQTTRQNREKKANIALCLEWWYLSVNLLYVIWYDSMIVRRPVSEHEHNDNVTGLTNITEKYKQWTSESPRESFNVFKKGAPSDLSIYFLKENMIYSLSWSVVGQNMETGRSRTFERSLYLIISVSLLHCTVSILHLIC